MIVKCSKCKSSNFIIIPKGSQSGLYCAECGAMMDFCTQCRKDRTYTLRKKTIKKEIRNKIYEFEITVAECDECGAEMDIPGLLDSNMKAIDGQYRLAEGLVSIEDIGKAPLSIALGFEENTITRYLAGQIPSKEHSDVIKKLVNKYRNNNEKIF